MKLEVKSYVFEKESLLKEEDFIGEFFIKNKIEMCIQRYLLIRNLLLTYIDNFLNVMILFSLKQSIFPVSL